MIQNVFLPKLGQTMEEATVERWQKKEGDVVKKGDVLLEITTDKATLEVESYAAGALRKILAPEGVVLPVNTVIALIGEPGDPLPDNLEELAAIASGEKKPAAEQKAAVAETEPSGPAASPASAEPTAAPTGRLLISPRARRRAKTEKAPLNVLRGSGPAGRIIEKDVLTYVDRRRKIKLTPTAVAVAYERGVDVTTLTGTGPGGRVTKADVLAAPAAAPVAAPGAAIPGKRVELSAMRRVVADRMSKSKREAPHFYLMMDVDMTAAAKMRKEINAKGETRIGFHDLIISAVARAMGEHPTMNVAWAGDAVIQREEINVELAVALEDGLIVPVVRGADKLSLAQVAAESKRLIDRARSKKLTPDEYEGGSFTISNLGMFDVDNFVPVINPGESAILGIGRIAEKPVVIEGKIQVRSMMGCTLSADHRSVDGATAAAFMKRMKELLEAPEELV